MYVVLFAVDGKHFQQIKRGGARKIWDYFNFNPFIREQLAINKFAKFQLINKESRQVIGELGIKEKIN